MIGLVTRIRWSWLLSAALAALLLLFPPLLSAQTEGISLKVEPFFSGHYKYGEWLPLRVTVTNSGASVSAQVRVEMSQTGGQQAWIVPLDLPTGAQKQFTLYTLPTSFAQVARVRVLNGTQELAKQNATLTLHPNTDYFVGVVAPRAEAFNAANTLTLNSTPARITRILPMTLTELPDRAEGLRALDALVLTGVDTSILTPAQTQVLTTWVQNGGRLIVGGGASAARTLGGLPDTLVGEFRTQDNLVELEELTGLSEAGEAEVRVEGPFVASFAPGGESIVEQDEGALVSEKRVGDGTVTYFALDPSLSPFDAWSGAPRFWQSVLAPRSAYPINSPPDVSPNLIRSRYMAMALQNLPMLALPSVNVLALLLGVYIVLVGPVNYLVLRRFRKLDWGWVTIPALTLLFAIGAFGVSNQLRGSDLILNQVSVVDFSQEGTPREMETVVGLFSPTRGTFDLQLPEAALVIPVSNAYDPFSPAGGAGTNVEIVDSNPVEVRGVDINQGALQAFAIQSPAPAEWGIDSDLKVVGEHVSGTLAQRLGAPITGAFLVNGERFLNLGTLAPDESYTIDQNWSRASGPVSNLVTGTTSEDEVKRQILSARFDYWSGMPQMPRTTMLIGWLDMSPLDVNVKDTAANRQAKTLVLMPLSPSYTEGTQTLGQADWRVQEISGMGGRVYCGSANYVGLRQGELVLEYAPLAEFQVSRVRALRLAVSEGVPHKIELLDDDDKWVAQELGRPTKVEIANPERFVREDGTVRVRITSDDVVERCVVYGLEMEVGVGGQ
jgi:hypothetical protein